MARRGGHKKLLQFVDAVVEIAARELVEQLAVDADEARRIAHGIAKELCFRYARTVMYIPADLSAEMELQLSARDKEIWVKYGQDGADGARKWTPGRLAQLSQEYKLSVAHLYCIVKLMQRREVESRQGQFPGFDVPE